ncbi:MAG: hypothetical protein ACK4N5_22510 [Myxococcales bacterium]
MRRLWRAALAVALLGSGCGPRETVRRDEPVDDFVTRVRMASPFEVPVPEDEPDDHALLLPETEQCRTPAKPRARRVSQDAPGRRVSSFSGLVQSLDGRVLVIEDADGARREMVVSARTQFVGFGGAGALQEGLPVQASYALEGDDLVATEIRLLRDEDGT